MAGLVRLTAHFVAAWAAPEALWVREQKGSRRQAGIGATHLFPEGK